MKHRPMLRARALIMSLLAIGMGSSALAASALPAQSPSARIQPYLIAKKRQEIALARSAAPPSISMHATVLVLGAHGYATEVKGSNGFVCLLVRSWDNAVSVDRTEFWNPKFRAPFCFNPAGARSVLPRYLMRTKWVLAGASRREIGEREKNAWAEGKLEEPAAGAMCYMMSRQGRWIGNQPGPWRPHLMFYFPRAHAPSWGANLRSSPVFLTTNADTAVMYVLVPVWSDGTKAPRFN